MPGWKQFIFQNLTDWLVIAVRRGSAEHKRNTAKCKHNGKKKRFPYRTINKSIKLPSQNVSTYIRCGFSCVLAENRVLQGAVRVDKLSHSLRDCHHFLHFSLSFGEEKLQCQLFSLCSCFPLFLFTHTITLFRFHSGHLLAVYVSLLIPRRPCIWLDVEHLRGSAAFATFNEVNGIAKKPLSDLVKRLENVKHQVRWAVSAHLYCSQFIRCYDRLCSSSFSLLLLLQDLQLFVFLSFALLW